MLVNFSRFLIIKKVDPVVIFSIKSVNLDRKENQMLLLAVKSSPQLPPFEQSCLKAMNCSSGLHFMTLGA
jgi:hypothetical protein